MLLLPLPFQGQAKSQKRRRPSLTHSYVSKITQDDSPFGCSTTVLISIYRCLGSSLNLMWLEKPSQWIIDVVCMGHILKLTCLPTGRASLANHPILVELLEQTQESAAQRGCGGYPVQVVCVLVFWFTWFGVWFSRRWRRGLRLWAVVPVVQGLISSALICRCVTLSKSLNRTVLGTTGNLV